MALTIQSLSLTSGITVQTPCLAITQLATSNSTSINESLNDDNEVHMVESGSHSCNFQLGIFANEQAVIDKLPPIDVFREGRHIKIFQIRLDDEPYQEMSPREAAYAYLESSPEFIEATISQVVSI